MRISEMLGQYNKNVSNGSEELRSAQNTGKMVSTLGELETGNIFEGTVNSVKNGRVTLALSNGQMISARLDAKVSLTPGDSMFFQVRSNDGTTVAIKPYTTESGVNNPILLNALSAAGIPATERSVAMVDAMMQEQMSVGKQGILDMVKVLNNNPDVKVSTLVQMTKIGLPVSVDMAEQFENYLTDRHDILGEVEQAIGQLSQALGGEELSAPESFLLYSQILDIFQQENAYQEETAAESMEQGAASKETTAQTLTELGTAAQIVSEQGTAVETAAEPGTTAQKAAALETADTSQSVAAENTEGRQSAAAETTGAKQTVTAETQGAKQAVAAESPQGTGGALKETPVQTIEQILDGKQLENLKQLLQHIPTLTGNTELFASSQAEDIFVDTMQDEDEAKAVLQQTEENTANAGQSELNKNMTAAEFLNTVKNALAQNSEFGFAGVKRLFASREFQVLLKNVAEQQWMLKPGELREENKVNQLYERMENQMKQMEQALKLAGITENSFTSTAAQVRGNIEFMNQINQIYTYVQIPLKLIGQNASSELYVYTNKKNLKDPDAELTAFLHLDLENLGSTDVSVKMLRKNVKTKFYIDNDASYDLIEKHLPVLEKRLKNKGYTCSITIANEEKQVEFVKDFLQKDMPPTGSLHRYSFDMKA